MKRHHTEWENIFVNDISNKGLIFKTYKQHIQLNSKRIILLKKKQADNLNR